jgi:hypothetical protein
MKRVGSLRGQRCVQTEAGGERDGLLSFARSAVAGRLPSLPSPHISPFHSGREAKVMVSGLSAAKAACGAIAKLFGAPGRDGANALPPSIPPTVMLTQEERDAALTWRVRAAAELRSIREDGLLGRNWRRHPRTIFLIGYLTGTGAAIETDNAARN